MAVDVVPPPAAGKWRTSALALVATAALSLGLIAAPASPAAAAVTNLYASPTGSGSTCSQSAPCSLTGAQTKVRTLNAAATDDVVVILAGGTYALTSPLAFTHLDSGNSTTHRVIWRAAAGAKPVFSGGQSITGWSLKPGSSTIWQADAPANDTRQIFVNGLRAGVTQQNTATVFTSMTKTATGYTYTATGPNSWTNASASSVDKVNFVFGGGSGAAQWTYTMCEATSVGGGVIDMEDACWSIGSVGGFHWGIPTAVENNEALLGTPGQFYIDHAADKIYYVPRAGETMTTADVIAPQLEELVSLDGTTANPVKNLLFEGISFQHTTWTFDGRGVVSGQGNSLWAPDPDPSKPVVQRMIPGAADCVTCQNVNFVGNSFTRLGGTGLAYIKGSSNSSITGNTFTDISGNGIQVGIGGLPAEISESGFLVSNNAVWDVSNEYQGGDGIFVGFARDTTVSHNEVWDVPYTGITLGVPVTDRPDIVQGNNKILNNYVHDFMSGGVRDGGGIYVAGATSSSMPSLMEGNFVEGSPESTASLYLDSAATYWSVKRNVIDEYTHSWYFVQYGNGAPAYYNDATDNYVNVRSGGASGAYNYQTNTVGSNNTGLTSWPQTAKKIIANAGLELPYQGLVDGGNSLTNLAMGKLSTASSSYSSGWVASRGNDGASSTVYASGTGDTTPWYQVDLGASHPVSQLQIVKRTDGNQPENLTNIKVQVSNSSDPDTGATVACTTGSIPSPTQSLYNCALPPGAWRYVSIVKTDNSFLSFSELRVFGNATTVTTVDDHAQGFTWSGSWVAEGPTTGGAGNYRGTQHYAAGNGAYYTYDFYGTGVNVISAIATHAANIEVFIDGVSVSTDDCYTSGSTDRACAAVSGLSLGNHTLKVVKLSGTYVSLDALQVISPPNLARSATASASSQYNSTYAATNVNDGTIGLHTEAEWSSNGESAPWVTLTWPNAVSISSLTFFDRPNSSDNAVGGTLTFSDGGTSLPVSAIPANGAPRTVSFAERQVTWVKFQVAGSSGTNIGLSELMVTNPDLNVAPLSTATASSTFSTAYAPSKAADGNLADGWASLGELKPWLQYDWNAARAVSSVVIHDRPGVDWAKAGTLTFSDGSAPVTVTGIPDNGSVTVPFTSRSVTWVRFTVTDGAGYNVGIAEMKVYPF